MRLNLFRRREPSAVDTLTPEPTFATQVQAREPAELLALLDDEDGWLLRANRQLAHQPSPPPIPAFLRRQAA